MSEMEFEGLTNNIENTTEESPDLIRKIEEALRIFKKAEYNLNDAGSDYGEIKIARLQFDFARHELLSLIKEADDKGIEWEKDDVINGEDIKELFDSDSGNVFDRTPEDAAENKEQ
jgi:hypothetical protein